MEDEKERESHVVFGRKKVSRLLKSAVRKDDGRRKAFWWRKLVKPRETGGILVEDWLAPLVYLSNCTYVVGGNVQEQLTFRQWRRDPI